MRTDAPECLTKRWSIACVMFIFDVLSERVNSPNLLSVLDLITPRYLTCDADVGDFHWTNYGLHEPMSGAMRQFSEVIGLFEFGLTRDQFLNCLKLYFYTYPTLHRFSESIAHWIILFNDQYACSVNVFIRGINSFSWQDLATKFWIFFSFSLVFFMNMNLVLSEGSKIVS
jgi:hypothetical protein